MTVDSLPLLWSTAFNVVHSDSPPELESATRMGEETKTYQASHPIVHGRTS